MASSVDSLISQAERRASSFSTEAVLAAQTLYQFVNAHTIPDFTADKKLLIGGVAPEYVAPGPENSPTPVYTPSTVALPAAPTFQDIGTVTPVPERVAPTVNTSGLFLQTAPSSNLPDFNEAEPDIKIDDLVAELASLPLPQLMDIQFPEISPLALSDRPTLDLPVFDAPPLPDAIRDPEDYAAKMDSVYHQMAPEMQAFIDDKMNTWIAEFAPEYTPWLTQLQSKIEDGMTNTVLPDQIEAAMFTRARGRTAKEFDSVEQTTLDSYAKSGFLEPPGTLVSAMLTTRLKNAQALSDQSTDIYVERRKTEIQHLQFSLNLASAQIQSVRSTAINYAQIVNSSLQLASSYASSISDRVAKIYEHLIDRAKLAVDIVNAVGAQYELKLKAAMSALEGYKLELETEQAKTQIEVAKIQALEGQIKLEEVMIQRYSAMVDAVTKKGSLEELKLKGYSIRADIFKARTQAAVAGFEVYKASIDGDRAKLEGELSKVKLFEAQLEGDSLQLQANVKQLEAVSMANKSKADIYNAEAEVYRLSAEAALRAFTAQAEVKKMLVSVHGQELANAVEVFKGQTEVYTLIQEAVIKEYTARMQVAIEKLKIEISKLEISEKAAEAIAQAMSSMGSSALGSLNSMVSSTISA